MEHTTASVTVQVLESKTAPGYKNPGDVEFCVQYPADYKGLRRMPEGMVTVSRESAEIFTQRGIGYIVGEEPTLHTITEEDLENNPDLKGQVEVGEVVALGPQLTDEEVHALAEEIKPQEAAPAEDVKSEVAEPAPAPKAEPKKKGSK